MVNKITDIKSHTAKMNILYVEDYDEIRINTTELLENFFNSVDSCEDGEKALEKYKDFKKEHNKFYDIVMSDIEMPKINGIELTAKIHEINPSQEIIIVSAYDDSEYLLKLVNLGIRKFIKKPIDYQELLAVFLDVSKKITDNNLINTQEHLIKINTNSFYDKNAKCFIINNENIYLTKFEIIFIELLILNSGKLFSNNDVVLHYKKFEENLNPTNIRKLVSKLRKKLEEDCFESVYGVGYRIVLEDGIRL